MYEKATETNKNESIAKNVNLMAIDELYYKIKAQQKLTRCKSANIKNNKRTRNDKLNNNTKNLFQNEILKKHKNNSIELPSFSPKNSTILTNKHRTINLTYLLKTNDSKRIDSTKQSTRIRVFSGKTNSSYSIMNKTKLFDNKKKNQSKKKSLSVININADIEKYFNNNNSKNKTLKDLNIHKLINKSKMIDYNKFIERKKDNKNIEKAKVYDLMPGLLSYLKQKENSNDKIVIENNKKTPLSHHGKNNKIEFFNSNYSVNYKFLDNIIDSIHHIVNFVDIEKREEIKQNVVKNYDDDLKHFKIEDFRTYGYEFDPEIIKKKYQDKKQKLIRQKYKELKKQILLENLKNVAFQKMLSPKMNKNYIPEYIRIQNEIWNKKRRLKNRRNMIDRSTSIRGLKNNTNKENENDNNTINEYLTNSSKKKSINNDLKSIINEKEDSIKDQTPLNINKINKVSQNSIDLLINDLSADNSKKDYNKIVSIVKGDNFFLKGYIKDENTNKIDIIKNDENEIKNDENKGGTVTEKRKKQKKSSKKVNKKLLKKKSTINLQNKKTTVILDNNYQNGITKIQIHFKNSRKDVNQSSNFDIIKSNLIKEEKRNKTRKKSKISIYDNRTKSSYMDTKKSEISIEEIEKRLIERSSKKQATIRNKPKSPKNIPENKDKENEEKNNVVSPENVKGAKKKEKKENEKIEKYDNKKEKYKKQVVEEEKENKEINEDINDKIKGKYNNKEEDINSKSIEVKEDIRITLSKKKLSRASMINFIQEHNYNSLTYLINQKYEEIEKKNNEINLNNIDKEILENQRRFSSFKGVNITSVEDIEYNKNVLLYKLKEDIKNKIKEGKCDINELENFKKFENKINEYQINYNSKDINKIKEYFLLISKQFQEYQDEMNYRETQKLEEMRINKFIKNLNYELDFNVPRAIWEKGRRCRSSDLYKKLISLSDIKKN